MEHRWGRRQSTDLAVRFFVIPGKTWFGRVLNISSSGAYLETTVRLRPLTLLYLEPARADHWRSGNTLLAASVVRQDAIGVGLEWCESGAKAASVDSRMLALAGDGPQPRAAAGLDEVAGATGISDVVLRVQNLVSRIPVKH